MSTSKVMSVLQGDVYLLGTGSDHGAAAGICIQRLNTTTVTWQRSELFPANSTALYNTGATPVVSAKGRIWRALEGAVRSEQTCDMTTWARLSERDNLAGVSANLVVPNTVRPLTIIPRNRKF
jgi:hypothetical protein